MEKELNIADILKEKPKGLKLWSPIFGECTFDESSCDNSCISVDTNESVPEVFYANGKYDENGECCIFPSKLMRDWSKFAWKKGDVLTNIENNFPIVFDHFKDDEYTLFNGKYAYDEDNEKWFTTTSFIETEKFNKAKDGVAKSHLRDIEEHYGGKLNLSTLKIEQPKQEFKDGDIVFVNCSPYGNVDSLIFISNGESSSRIFQYAAMCPNTGDVFTNASTLIEKKYVKSMRLATDSEKQLLLDALAKENKAWDAEKKMLVDLPKKCEFKTFDKVLIKDYNNDRWEIDFFAYYDEVNQIYITTSGNSWNFCLPYNDQTKHLLGTTDEWKGGEG